MKATTNRAGAERAWRFRQQLGSAGRAAAKRRVGGALLAAGAVSAGTVAGMVALPAAGAQARPGLERGTASVAVARPERPLAPSESVATFCSHMPAKKVSSIVGTNVVLREAVPGHMMECLYEAVSILVVVSKETGMSPSEIGTLADAEKTIGSTLPPTAKVTFKAIPSLGPTAFTFTYTEDGHASTGLAVNKGSTGYGVLISGPEQLPKLEKLIELDFTA